MAISTMLVPVSLDQRDVKVIEYVCGLSVQSVRHVIVATAVDASGMEAPVLAAEVDRARERLGSMTSALRDCTMDYEIRVVTGSTAESILALAQQDDVDVICCGTEGKSVVDALFSGSVSEKLFVSGQIRTMTVRYDLLDTVDDARELSRDFARRLVVPTDFSATATRAWLSAISRPGEAIGELHALHVLPESARGSERREAEVMLEGFLDMAREHDIEAIHDIRFGDPTQVVLDYLSEVHATGVITGQHGRGRLMRKVMLGGLSLRLLRDAPCPVVVQP
jgi:nucleotide-binding universal stress UspA family protein